MAKNQKLLLWSLVIFGVILLSVPYLVPHSGLIMLMALMPLLQINKLSSKYSVKKVWIYYYSMFFLWNLFTTYWIYKATLPGAIAAVVLNALQMSLIFGAYRWFEKKTNKSLSYLFLILAWLAWEHFYYEAEISWPWLTLGNGLATTHKNIQWYEYTGALGGSLWILLTNIMVFEFTGIIGRFSKLAGFSKENSINLIDVKGRRTSRELFLFLFTLFVIHFPFVYSQIMYRNYKEVVNPREFVVVQPNIDPYNDKFGGMSQNEQDNKLFGILEGAVTNNTHIIVAPETFTSGIIENMPENTKTIERATEYLKLHPNASMIFGATSHFFYVDLYKMPGYGNESSKPTYTARKTNNGDWYDSYNTAVFIDSSGNPKFYHKSKLVVLVEYLPYPQYLPFISNFMVNLGGSSGSYGTQEHRTVFTADSKCKNDSFNTQNNTVKIKIGSAICYESIYGDFYREFVLNGANFMSIITNDGWWGDTPGYKQHLRYASLRAIETRRSIARSANTGISALIDQRGDIIQQTKWWEPAYLRGNLNLNEKITVFVKYGDIIGRVAYYSMLLFLGLAILLKLNIYAKERR